MGKVMKNKIKHNFVHKYLDEESKRVTDVGFEVLKSVKNEQQQLMTKRLYDCMETADDSLKEELSAKNLRAVNAFLGTSFETIEPQKEYSVSQLLERIVK